MGSFLVGQISQRRRNARNGKDEQEKRDQKVKKFEMIVKKSATLPIRIESRRPKAAQVQQFQ